ncbi:siroheme synthase, N-terminal domain [Coprococcus sp. ART55/1]|nr:siroheme synthase, N-terminal domain [Coprococcus sp. ART55/1]
MIELNNERCLIAGGGTVAYRKVCSMLEFGAVVTVVSPEFCPELLELAWRLCVSDKYSSGHLTLVKRCVQPQDIDGAFVVIMATDDEKVNHDMAELCRQQRILVNVVDVKADCGFYFPAIIKDKEVVISVSTGGQSPVLAGTIKRNIESHLGRSYGDIAERMGELREQIKAQIDGEEERKKAFQQMVRSLLDES